MKVVLISILIVIILGGLFIFFQYKKFSSVTEGTIISKYDTPQKALLVIDLQKDLTDKEGKAVINIKQTDEAIRHVNKIIENAKQHNLIVVYIRHEVQPNFIIDFITKGVLAEGSSGSEIDPRIKVVNDNVFVKHVMDTFSNKEFENFLFINKVDHIVLTGVDAEACVDRTLKAALKRGYEATVINDAIATKDDARLIKKIKEYKEIGARITTTKALLEEHL